MRLSPPAGLIFYMPGFISKLFFQAIKFLDSQWGAVLGE
jgi:hypothetical protein